MRCSRASSCICSALASISRAPATDASRSAILASSSCIPVVRASIRLTVAVSRSESRSINARASAASRAARWCCLPAAAARSAASALSRAAWDAASCATIAPRSADASAARSVSAVAAAACRAVAAFATAVLRSEISARRRKGPGPDSGAGSHTAPRASTKAVPLSIAVTCPSRWLVSSR